jgi:Uncharacterised protein family (UPF0236)
MKPDPSLERLVDAALAQLREKLLRELSDGTASHGSLDQIEDAVARIGDQFRRSLQEQIIAERTTGPRDNQIECACGQRARYHTTRTRLLLTRHGELRIARPYYYCPACRRGSVPLDAALGLDAATATPHVQGWMADLAARLPFAEAATVLGRLTPVTVSPATVERTALAVGAALRRKQQEQATRHHDGQPPTVARKPKRLYISLDGTFVPLRDPWRRDRSLGELACRYGECKTAVLYEAHPTPQGDRGVAHCAYTATLEDVTQFAPLVATLAHQQGHHFARELVVLADGAPWIWNLAAAQFPTALQILDFAHASGYLFALAHAVLGEESPQANEWARARQKELKQDELPQVLAAIRALVPRDADEEKLQRTTCHYFEENSERMRYGTFLSKGYQIASGVMEASCKHVVGQRLDEAGMHWREAAAEVIVALRAALLSSSPPDLRPYCCRSPSPLPPT